MARFGLHSHRKFLRLTRLLEEHCPECPAALASGVLELLWAPAYEAADDWIGVAEDVELRVGWRGQVGVLCDALSVSGFIDHDQERGGFKVHDLWDHAPMHVHARASRESERRSRGESLSDARRRAAQIRWAKHRLQLQAPSAPDMQVQSTSMQIPCGEGRGGVIEEPPIAPQGGRVGSTSKPQKRKSQQPVDLATLSTEERRLVVFWQEQCCRPRTTPVNLDIERLRACIADTALAAEYEVPTLRLAGLAIKGCSLSDFHMGREPGKPTKDNDLSLIFRDSKHVRRFVDIALAKKNSDAPPTPSSTRESFESIRQREIDTQQANRPELRAVTQAEVDNIQEMQRRSAEQRRLAFGTTAPPKEPA